MTNQCNLIDSALGKRFFLRGLDLTGCCLSGNLRSDEMTEGNCPGFRAYASQI